MYERWQRNLFPAISFDEFIAGVENIGRTGEVKVPSQHFLRVVPWNQLSNDCTRNIHLGFYRVGVHAFIEHGAAVQKELRELRLGAIRMLEEEVILSPMSPSLLGTTED